MCFFHYGETKKEKKKKGRDLSIISKWNELYASIFFYFPYSLEIMKEMAKKIWGRRVAFD
jgi:hypothetical protein